MLFYISVLLCLAVIVSGDNDLPDLQWPEIYSFDAIKLSLTSGWTENYRVWKTEENSRIDYNSGAVKSIVDHTSYRWGVKYEIHPETTEEVTNKMVCYKMEGSRFRRLYPEDILPSSDDYEVVGNENIRDKESVKFYYQDTDESTDTRKTLWASLGDNSTWIPVRYEEVIYNSWLGSLDKHEIWEFFNFKSEVDNDVFKTDEYDCEEQMQTMEDETTTRDLINIDPEKEEHVNHVFEAFKQKYKRNYAHEHEHDMRKSIFRRNMRLIVSRNRQNLGYKLSVNKFADLTPEEMKKHKGLLRRKEGDVGTVPFPYDKTKLSEIAGGLPKEFDLRLLGVISPVKNQEDCGSCWTFGTTGAVEGALARSNGGRLIRLSNQALIDCAWGFGAYGCDGGTDIAAYKWMITHGLPAEEEYGPYANKDGYCLIGNMTKIYPIRGFTDVTPYSVEALKVAVVNHGPLSVSVDASMAFSLYSGGIFYDPECDPTRLNHEVTLVGYGEQDGETYWIVKNSWGTNWGIDGYIHIAVRDNNCGIATEPTYVVF